MDKEGALRMDLNEIIQDSDMVLVGIGECFQEKFENIAVADENRITIYEEYERKKQIDKCENDNVLEAYHKLAKLLAGKNYYVITLCDDDKIYKSELKKDRIVAPCGTYSYLQCEDVCTEAIYPLEDYVEKIEAKEEILCPVCGKRLIMNRIGCKKYSEEGYLKKWDLYTKWLQGTLNKKIAILEFGVGMKYPSVIRWPFERIAMINKKAEFIRVHSTLYQLPEEIKEKGISVEENPIDFLRNQFV